MAMLMMIGLFVFIGAGLGFVGTRMMGMNTDVLTTMGLGILGAVAGFFIIPYLLRTLVVFPLPVSIGLGSVIGVLLIIWGYKVLFHKK